MSPQYKSIDEVMREQRQPQYMRLTLERVRTINRWRMQYMVLYFGWFFVQTLVYLFAAEGLSQSQILALGIAGTVLMVFFYLRFVQVLRAVAYSWLMVIPACLLALLPIPGILVVVYLDRTIGKTFSRGMARAQDEVKAREAQQSAEPDEQDVLTQAKAGDAAEIASEASKQQARE